MEPRRSNEAPEAYNAVSGGQPIYYESAPEVYSGDSKQQPEQRRRWKTIALALVAVLIILGIALGVGLGVGLRKSNAKSPAAAASGVPNTTSDGSRLPAKQPMLGTALSAITSDQKGHLSIFYQSNDGFVRRGDWVVGDWTVGQDNQKIVTDAKNNTPLAGVQLLQPSGSGRDSHLFYVDKNGVLQESVNKASSSSWNNGSLGYLEIMPRANTTIAACSGPWEGVSATATEFGINLYYFSSATTLEQVIWTNGGTQWTTGRPTSFDAASGITCLTFGYNTAFDSLQDIWGFHNGPLTFSYLDTGTTTQTQLHTLKAWAQVNIGIPDVKVGSAVSGFRYADFDVVFYQKTDLSLTEIGAKGLAENMTLPTDPVIIAKAAPNTHIASCYVGLANNTDRFYAFAQLDEKNGTISMFSRSYTAEDWFGLDVPY